MKRSVKLTALALAAPSLLSCAGVPNDDAGDVAFVHQAVQTLLCRRPRGVDEVQALVDIAVENAPDGRAAVVDVLLEQPEFVDCWTSILIDAMQMQRSSELTQVETCIDEPVYIVDGTGAPCAVYADCPAEVDALVAQISDIPATAATLGTDWNLNDAVRAGLLADDLHIAWRPWLFALAGAPSASVAYNASTREIRDNFMSTAFATKVDCIGCHSTTYSKSEVYPGYSTPLNPVNPPDANAHQNSWDRTATLGFDLHGDAFGTSATTVPIIAGDPGSIAFQANCAGCHGPDGTWLPTDMCVNTGPSPKRLTERVPLLTVEAIEAQILGGGGCMGPVPGAAGSEHDIAVFLRHKLGGWEDVSRYVEDAQFDTVGNGPWGMSPTLCGFTWEPDQIEDGASHSIGGYATSFTDISDVTYVVKQGLAALPAEAGGGVTPQTRVGPDIPSMSNRKAAVAGLLVANIADDLLEELTGTRTSVAHGLPRMKVQADTMRTLSSKLVVSDAGGVRISLKNALREALLSKFFNRRTPKDMQPAAPHLTDWAYQMPMYFDPWSATVSGVPTDDGNNLNGQGDIVHRRSPNRLTWSLHHDLGWPRPAVFPLPTATFPSKELMRQVGRYESSVRPGTTMWRMDSLLLWEEELAACQNPDPAVPDFITVLVDGDYATATLGDLALGLKDRLLQEPVFSSETFGPGGEDEAELVEGYFDTVLTGAPATLASPATTWTKNKVTQAMRKYCGVLLVSPDYLMANLPTVTTLASAPTVVACLPGEPCTHADHVTHYCASLPAPYTCPP